MTETRLNGAADKFRVFQEHMAAQRAPSPLGPQTSACNVIPAGAVVRPEIAAGILDDAIGRYEHLLSRLASADRRLEARVARFAGSSPVQCEGKDGEPRPIPSGVTARLFDLGQQLHVQMEAIEEKLERLEQL